MYVTDHYKFVYNYPPIIIKKPEQEPHKCTLLSPTHFLDRGHGSECDLPRKEENMSSYKGYSIYWIF